jgi:AcrR family transcriptional regulator
LPGEVYDVNIFSVTSVDLPESHPYHHGDLRNALVEAGVELAREGGPGAIVLREAARRVGVSATAAYRHFHALPDLVQAVAHVGQLAMARRMEVELAQRVPSGDAAHDAVEFLIAVGRGYVRFAFEEPGLFMTAFSHPGTTTEEEARNEEGEPSPYGLLVTSLDGLVDAGLLEASEYDIAATTAWAAVHGLSTLLPSPIMAIPPEQLPDLIEGCLVLIARGLIAPRPSSRGPQNLRSPHGTG